MRLLYITNGLSGSGGLERVLSIKLSYMADNYKYEVHIITLNEDRVKPFYVFSHKIQIHSIALSKKTRVQYLFHYIKQMREKVNKIQPDIISVCDDGLKGFCFPFLITHKIPIIYERHMPKIIWGKNSFGMNFKRRMNYFLMNLFHHQFDCFVVLTDGNKSEWSGKNVIVIPNPSPFNIEKKVNFKLSK
ncbi:MAG: glycosyltransferase [Bacteroides sp.]|nr:glycosyltransferase [Bacteroides sp.]